MSKKKKSERVFLKMFTYTFERVTERRQEGKRDKKRERNHPSTGLLPSWLQ